jgi:nucleoside-diphosphate-sugar epimerase
MWQGKVFILGGGFIGFPLAAELKKHNYEVQVVLKSEKRLPQFEQLGIPAEIRCIGSSIPLVTFSPPEILVIAYPIGSRSNDAPNITSQVSWIAQSFPESSVKQVILTSSTSVYPDGYGAVDEHFDLCSADSGNPQLQYEERLKEVYGNKLTIYRLAGLVGADRHPGRFLAGRKFLPNPNSPVNMVHQMDVVRFLISGIVGSVKGEVFNLCHDNHPERKIYFIQAALALGLEPPTFSEEQIEKPKVVLNTKSKRYFGLDYEFDITF